jgi:nicotinamidase-related amidase
MGLHDCMLKLQIHVLLHTRSASQADGMTTSRSPISLRTLADPLTAAALSFVASLVGCAHAAPPAPAPRLPGPTLRALYGIPRVARIDANHAALVLVDFQEEFFHGKLPIPDGELAKHQAEQLLAWARRSNLTVVHVRNLARPASPLFAPGSPTTAIVPSLAPRSNELVVTKPTGGAFTKTDLDATLHARNLETLVVAGIMTHLAVAMTAQDATVLGYHVVVAADATATRDLPGTVGAPPVDHTALQQAALASIADRFADVMPTHQILALPLVPAP